jgi:hypothetical protein
MIYTPPNIISQNKIIKSERMRWTRYVAQIRRRETISETLPKYKDDVKMYHKYMLWGCGLDTPGLG